MYNSLLFSSFHGYSINALMNIPLNTYAKRHMCVCVLYRGLLVNKLKGEF